MLWKQLLEDVGGSHLVKSNLTRAQILGDLEQDIFSSLRAPAVRTDQVRVSAVFELHLDAGQVLGHVRKVDIEQLQAKDPQQLGSRSNRVYAS